MNLKTTIVTTILIIAAAHRVCAQDLPALFCNDLSVFQLTIPSSVQRQAGPVVIRGPLESVDWAALVGRDVLIEGTVEVIDTYNLIRFGEVRVARQRLFVPTSRIDPNDRNPGGVSFTGGNNVRPVIAAQKSNDSGVLTIDDGLRGQNIFPPKLFPELGSSQPTVRIGSKIQGLSGRIMRQRNQYVLNTNGPLNWVPAKRPKRPDVGSADVTVASFNVQNYFTTIDNGRNKARGADSASELTRQQAKLVSAIIELKADVVGLMELENNLAAEKRLVAALNKASGKEVFAGCGLPEGFSNAPGGSDSIRVGLIYRKDRISTVGNTGLVNHPAFHSARVPIFQAFQSNNGGKLFSVIVNHFKSKGGANDADSENKNQGDGQAAYNAARRTQSMAIVDFVRSAIRTQSQSRVLVLGDLNAYQQEDPIDVLRAGGLIDLHSRNRTSTEKIPDYSFVYRGQSGSLDHAFATENLAKDVTGVATWHINADEPRFLDYNEEFNPQSLFKADPFRSSDHDPVLIGIRN